MEAVKKYTKIIKHNKTYSKLLIQLPSRTENIKKQENIDKNRNKLEQIEKQKKK